MVTVFRDEPGKPQQVVARLEEGGFFGEMGLLNDKARRYASARTAAPTVLLRIDKADLIQILATNPGLELKFRAEVIRRHGMNVSALLGLAGQRDVRIRLGVDAVLELPDGTRLSVTLENLSLGGVGLSGVPVDWQTGHPVRFRLGLPGEPDDPRRRRLRHLARGGHRRHRLRPRGRRQRPGGAAGAAAVPGFAAVEEAAHHTASSPASPFPTDEAGRRAEDSSPSPVSLSVRGWGRLGRSP